MTKNDIIAHIQNLPDTADFPFILDLLCRNQSRINKAFDVMVIAICQEEKRKQLAAIEESEFFQQLQAKKAQLRTNA